MAIQNRRGIHTDFDATKMVAGEFAIVQSGDPNNTNGTSVYICFQNGSAKRLALVEDLDAVVGSLSNLETTDKTSIVDAINELAEKSSILFGTSSTGGSTRDKVVTCADFEAVDGALIAITVSQTNTATDARFNVNGTGAKSIYSNYEASADTSWLTKGTYLFVYNSINGGRFTLIGATERIASDTAPLMDGTAAVGTSKKYARADHVHPSDTTRATVSALNAEATARASADAALDADITDLKSELNNIYSETLLNGYDKDSVEGTSGYWSNSDGNFVSNSSYYACNKYARVKPSTSYSLWYGTGTAGLYCYVCFYDIDKTFISGSTMASSNIIASPANAKYVRISVQKSKSNYVFCEGTTYSGYSAFGYDQKIVSGVMVNSSNYETDKSLVVPGNIADANVTGSLIDEICKITNIALLNGYDKTDRTTGGSWSTTDGVSLYPSSSGVACNKYALIYPGKKYSAWYMANGNITASLYTSVCWYDGAKNFISGETNTSSNIFTAPSNARYARVSTFSNREETFVFNAGETFIKYNAFGYSEGTNQVTKEDLYYFTPETIVEGIIVNGDVTSSDENMFCLNYITAVPVDVTLLITFGWRLHLFYYINGEQTSPTTGWYIYDTYTIPANTPFSFYFQKTDGSSANLSEAQKAVSISGYSVADYVHNQIEPVYYYHGEKIPINKNQITANFKYNISFESLPSGGLQACDLYNGVLCVCRGDNILMLYDYADGSQIANTNAPVGHGNAFQFGTKKYDVSDEFPMAYASPFFDTEEDSFSIVNKIRVTRSGGTLLARYKMPVSDAGYYGAGCINDEDSILYVVGYKVKDYVTGTGNALIISAWDLTQLTTNQDSSYTPAKIKSFELPFRMMMQGVKYINERIIACHAPYDGNIVFHSNIFVIDVIKQTVSSEFEKLPITINSAELEDSFFVETYYGTNLGVLMANGIVQELRV